jgi:uncharacterized protein (UPF0297 family)
MKSDTTYLFEIKDFDDALILDTLKDVYLALEERGYNPINQLVGYLMSGDPGYISSHKEARNKIMKLDRTRVLEVIVKNYIQNFK